MTFEQCTVSSGLIIPDNIPGDDLDPAKLEATAVALRLAGSTAASQAETAESTWAGMPAALESPEGPTIYAALDTPGAAARTVRDKFDRVAVALEDFAAAVRPIKRTFAAIKTDAVAFRATIRADERVWVSPGETKAYEHDGLAVVSSTSYHTSYSTGSSLSDVLSYLRGRGETARSWGGRPQILAHWTESSEHVDQNNALMDRLADAYTLLQNAEADCANAINRQRDLCVAEVQHLEAWQLKQSGDDTAMLPWGHRVDEDRNCGESVWWGVGSAGKETLEGLGTLIGRDSLSGKFSWETAGQGWLGVAAGIGTLLVVTSPPLAILGRAGVPVLSDAVAMGDEMVKGLLAWDTWSENPAEAFGRVLFNVGTIFIPGAGAAGAAVKGLTAGVRVLDAAIDGSRFTTALLNGAAKVDSIILKVDGLVSDAITGVRTGIDDLVTSVRRGDGPDVDDFRVRDGAGDETPPMSPVGADGAGGADAAGSETPRVDPDRPGSSRFGESFPPHQGRIYQMMDDQPHETRFAPEQLGASRVTDDILQRNGLTRQQMSDLLLRRWDEVPPAYLPRLEGVLNDLPPIHPDSVFQKVLEQPWIEKSPGVSTHRPGVGYQEAPGALHRGQGDAMLQGETFGALKPDEIRGSITLADDTAHLSTPQQLFEALRLDYDGTRFRHSDASVFVVRFQLDDLSGVTPSKNSSLGGDGLTDHYTRPYTGHGYLGAVDDVIPELKSARMTMRGGAEMWEVLSDGAQRLAAVLRKGSWIPQG